MREAFSSWNAWSPQSSCWTGISRCAEPLSWAADLESSKGSSNWGNSMRLGCVILLLTWMPKVPSCTTRTSDHCWSLGTAPKLATCSSSPCHRRAFLSLFSLQSWNHHHATHFFVVAKITLRLCGKVKGWNFAAGFVTGIFFFLTLIATSDGDSSSITLPSEVPTSCDFAASGSYWGSSTTPIVWGYNTTYLHLMNHGLGGSKRVNFNIDDTGLISLNKTMSWPVRSGWTKKPRKTNCLAIYKGYNDYI